MAGHALPFSHLHSFNQLNKRNGARAGGVLRLRSRFACISREMSAGPFGIAPRHATLYLCFAIATFELHAQITPLSALPRVLAIRFRRMQALRLPAVVAVRRFSFHLPGSGPPAALLAANGGKTWRPAHTTPPHAPRSTRGRAPNFAGWFHSARLRRSSSQHDQAAVLVSTPIPPDKSGRSSRPTGRPSSRALRSVPRPEKTT